MQEAHVAAGDGTAVSDTSKTGAIAFGWPVACASAAVVFCLYLFVASRTTLWDRDEPRFAQATLEMIKSGNYLYPTFNGSLRPDKPIMIYWLMTVAVRIFGANEVGFRCVAALSIALSGVGTYWIGRRLLNPRAAFWSMLALVGTPLAAFEGTAATTDALLLAIFTAMMATLFHSFKSDFSFRHALIFGLLGGAALLTKGPIGIGIPLLGAIGMNAAWAYGNPEARRVGRAMLNLAFAALLAIAIFVAWGIPANNATISTDYPRGEYLETGLGHHVVGRMSKPLEHHGGNFLVMLPYYIPVVILGFLPWTLLLPAGLLRCARGECGGAFGKALIFGWIIPTFALVTLIATKLPHYILPVWPALALSVGATLDAAQCGALSEIDLKRVRWGAWLSMWLSVALGVVMIILPRHLAAESLKVPGIICGAAVIAVTLASLVMFHAHKIVAGTIVFAVAALLFPLLVCMTILPAVEEYKLTARMACALDNAVPHSVPVVTCQFDEPSMILYLNRGHITDLHNAKEFTDWMLEKTPSVVVIQRETLHLFQSRWNIIPAGLEEVASVKGFDYSKGTVLELVALKRPEN